MAKRTRYTDKKKREVVEFVKKFDADNGRGGKAAANKKWGINPITITSWCDQLGYSSPSRGKAKPKAKAKPAAAKKATRKPARKPARKKARKTARKPAAAAARSAAAPVKGGSTASTLAKMSKIQNQIDSLQSEFDSLKAQL